ncbi:MAG: hypothetical protein GX851_05860, partial [Clostridiales bacterium]|nr:hypothetical protein [Clostridiales bacterium]
MNIPMPSASEKRSSIEFIKTAGLKKKRTLLSVSAELFRDFGLKNTFFGISDCLYVALLCAVIAVCLVLAIETKFVYTLLMTVSPVIYIAVYLLSMWKDSMTDTLDVTRCCKYTYAQVTALRMLIFSLVSIAADIPLAAAGAISSGTSFWRLLLISFCALFI